jgi:hypothetical protein
VIIIENKGCLMHELIFNDLVRRRKDQLDSLRRGLEVLGFLSLLKRHRKVAENVLLYRSLEINEGQFLSFLTSQPVGHVEKQAPQLFLEYIALADGVKNNDFPQG